MENEKRNKTLSRVLIALGIIMSIGGLIVLIGGFANMWNLHELDAKDWLFGTIIGGFNIWILGILIGRKHRWDKKTAKDILSLKILILLGFWLSETVFPMTEQSIFPDYLRLRGSTM